MAEQPDSETRELIARFLAEVKDFSQEEVERAVPGITQTDLSRWGRDDWKRITGAKRRAIRAFLDGGGQRLLVREPAPRPYGDDGSSDFARELRRIEAMGVSEREKLAHIEAVAAGFRAEALRRDAAAAELRALAMRADADGARGRQEVLAGVPTIGGTRVDDAPVRPGT